MVVTNASKRPKISTNSSTNKQSGTPEWEARPLLVRYKTQTAATAAEISIKTERDLARHLEQMFKMRASDFGYTDEYHTSLLSRYLQTYDSNLPMIYQIDDLREGNAPPLSVELAQMRPAFDFDGKRNPIWEHQLVDALIDARRFATHEFMARGLRLGLDFDVYFTGSKGFRVTCRGLTPIGTPGALCDAIQIWCQDRSEMFPTLDTGIYKPSPNTGFIRGVGSKHPETGLWSIPITEQELFDLPFTIAIRQITSRAKMSDSKARRMRRNLEPVAYMGLKEPESPQLQSFLQEIADEVLELAFIEKLRPTSHSPQKIHLEALIESEGLDLRAYIRENQVALLKRCPECGKESKAWITRSGRLRCFRTSCAASSEHGGLSLRKWAKLDHPEEIIECKIPQSAEPQLCEFDLLQNDLQDAKERFFTEEAEAPSILEHVSASCRKTTVALEGALEAVLRGDSIAYTTPTHKLSDEKITWLKQEAERRGIELPILRWRGRNAIDEWGPMCTRPKRVEDAQKHGLPINQAACRGCPIFQTCRYQSQYRKLGLLLKAQKEEGLGFLFVGSHHALWGLMQAELFTPARVIIDEDPANACIQEHELTLRTLTAPYAEPKELEVDLRKSVEPVRELLYELIQSAKKFLQKEHDRAIRKARKKGSNWLGRLQLRAAQDGLIELLLSLDSDAPNKIREALEALREAKKEVLERDEEERPLWISALSSVFFYLPTLEAFEQILSRSVQENERQTRGFSIELEFELEANQNKKEEQKQNHLARRKLLGGTFRVLEARALPYKGPVMGLDATGETLPWEAMLGRELEILHRDAPLHPESKVDWIELATYQSTLVKEEEAWIKRYLLPRVRYHYERGERIVIFTWMKEGPTGSYKQKVIECLEQEGFPVDGIQLDVAHFFAERGHNSWRGWDVGILWGMPVENPDALRMKCEALGQLLPSHQREELREQLLYQCSAGEALQALNRVGAIMEAKQWVVFASSSYLPLADYLKQITAPEKFRKVAGRSNEAKDPTRLEKLEEISQKIASLGFFNQRAVAGLMGLDPIARSALIRLGLLEPGEYPLGRLSVGFDHIPMREGTFQPQSGTSTIGEVIETYSAKAFEALLGRREQQRISKRVHELTSWGPEHETQLTFQDDDALVRPYRVVGDAELGYQFLSLCLELEGSIQQQNSFPDQAFELSEESNELLRQKNSDALRQLLDLEEEQYERWPDVEGENIGRTGDGAVGIIFNDALAWVSWLARQHQWEREQQIGTILPQEEQKRANRGSWVPLESRTLE